MTFRSRETKLVGSLIDYALDVKPYHTKLKSFVSELFFYDSLTVTFLGEDFTPTVYLQNVWTKNDIGSLYLSNVSEGTEQDRSVPLPATIFSRWSLNFHLDQGQTPPGDDPATLDTVDADDSGVPDSEEPWTGGFTASHQLGSDEAPVYLPTVPYENVLGDAQHGSTLTPHLVFSSTVVTASTLVTFTATLLVSVSNLYFVVMGIPTTPDGVDVNGRDLTLTSATVSASGTTSSYKPDVVSTIGSGPMPYTFNTFAVTIAGTVPYADLPTNLYPTTQLALNAYLRGLVVQPKRVAGTGRFTVPFHHGSQVKVDGVDMVFGEDYVVDTSRSFIQFLAGLHPTADQHVEINYLNSDRIFISLVDPFDFGNGGYDMTPYDSYPYDLPDGDFDIFSLLVDHAEPNDCVVTFTNTYPGTVKATLSDIFIYPSQADGAIWTMTAVGFQTLAVQQQYPIVGPVEYAYLNQRFDNGLIAFTLTNPWAEYYFVQDDDSYLVYDASWFDLASLTLPNDQADFWPSKHLVTEHGVVTDPNPDLHHPVEIGSFVGLSENDPYDIHIFDDYPFDYDETSTFLRPIGVVRQVLVDTLLGEKPSYELYLNDVPRRGTYIEVRIEQARQYNPRVNARIYETLTFEVMHPSGSPSSPPSGPPPSGPPSGPSGSPPSGPSGDPSGFMFWWSSKPQLKLTVSCNNELLDGSKLSDGSFFGGSISRGIIKYGAPHGPMEYKFILTNAADFDGKFEWNVVQRNNGHPAPILPAGSGMNDLNAYPTQRGGPMHMHIGFLNGAPCLTVFGNSNSWAAMNARLSIWPCFGDINIGQLTYMNDISINGIDCGKNELMLMDANHSFIPGIDPAR